MAKKLKSKTAPSAGTSGVEVVLDTDTGLHLVQWGGATRGKFHDPDEAKAFADAYAAKLAKGH